MFFLFLSYFLSIGRAITINATNGIFYSPSHKMPVLSCHVDETESVIFDWSARGISITSRHIQVVSTESSTSLEFVFVDDSMLGDIYKCLAFDQHKVLLGSKKVTLYAKPQVSIKMQENSIYAWQNSDVAMVCTFWGNPFPRARWGSRIVDIMNEKSEKLTPYKSSLTITLKNVSRSNVGVYICQSINSIDSTKVAVNLRVRDHLSWGIPLTITLAEFLVIVTVILTSKGWHKWLGKEKARARNH